MAHHRSVSFRSTGKHPHLKGKMTIPEDMLLVEEPASIENGEPQNHGLSFKRLPLRVAASSYSEALPNQVPVRERQQSLLTQAILTSPSQRPLPTPEFSFSGHGDILGSAASTAELTSDGGLTSPLQSATPSPPLPLAIRPGLLLFDSKEPKADGPEAFFHREALGGLATQPIEEKVEVPRKRCIKFACSDQIQTDLVPSLRIRHPDLSTASKRTNLPESGKRSETIGHIKFAPKEAVGRQNNIHSLKHDAAWEDRENHTNTPLQVNENDVKQRQPKSPSTKRRSEALRYHDFAGLLPEEEDWFSAGPSHRQKITVMDTLRKENVIRKLGEEAEAEALEEKEEGLDNDDVEENDDDAEDVEDEDEDDSDDNSSYGGSSRDGNETDDEDGFAASDDESAGDSDDQLWVPTETKHPKLDRVHFTILHDPANVTSIQDLYQRPHEGTPVSIARLDVHDRLTNSPHTPDLPDITDFVCGPFDEDRKIEEEYLSCREQRRSSRRGTASGMTLANGDSRESRASGPETIGGITPISKPQTRAAVPMRCPRSPAPIVSKKGTQKAPGKESSKSTDPLKPGQRFRRPMLRLNSPCPDFRYQTSSKEASDVEIDLKSPGLGRRFQPSNRRFLLKQPHLLQEERSPSVSHAQSSSDESIGCKPSTESDGHPREPIDIVQDAANREMKRKAKRSRQHTGDPPRGQEGPQQCGGGAERMRLLGLQVADRCRGYGQRIPPVPAT